PATHRPIALARTPKHEDSTSLADQDLGVRRGELGAPLDWDVALPLPPFRAQRRTAARDWERTLHLLVLAREHLAAGMPLRSPRRPGARQPACGWPADRRGLPASELWPGPGLDHPGRHRGCPADDARRQRCPSG